MQSSNVSSFLTLLNLIIHFFSKQIKLTRFLQLFMKYFILGITLFLSVNSIAQIPAGGVEIINPPLEDFYFYDADQIVDHSIVPVSGQSFTQAFRVQVDGQPSNSWSQQLQFTETGGIKTGDIVLFSFWARVISSLEETGGGFATALVENNTTYDKEVYNTGNLTNEWVQYFAPFEAANTLAASEMSIAFHLGFAYQTIEIADIRVINYGDSKTLEEMPETEVTYIGREEDAEWRVAANERIEQVRKGDIEVSVLDPDGQPAEGAVVSIKMLEHEFGFGSAIAADQFLEDKQFRDTALALFNEYTLENALKWQSYQWSQVKVTARNTVDLMLAHDKRVRGHVLVWPSWRYNPDYLQDLEDDPEQLRAEINARIDEVVMEFNGDLIDWDVINEVYANHDFMDILGYDEMAEWFNRTRSINSSAKLYINDYSILSAGGLDLSHQDSFYSTIQQIDADGGMVEGIGLQSHFNNQLTPITKVYTILDHFAELKKDIKITEFDVEVNDQDLQADYTRDFMTIIFSHPSVKSFIMWGFWAGRHWKPEAAMYDLDWTPRKNLQAYKELVFDTWWTDEMVATADEQGSLTSRGYLGKYEITSTYKGEMRVDTVQVTNNSEVNSFTIDYGQVTGSVKPLKTIKPVYPNPTNGTVELPERLKFSVLNAEGIEVLSGRSRKLNLSNQPAGSYIIKTEKGNFVVVKK